MALPESVTDNAVLTRLPVVVAPPPLSSVQTLVAVQAYRFRPGDAAELKNCSPVWHVGGTTVPTVMGRVRGIAEKSGLVPSSPRFTLVDV